MRKLFALILFAVVLMGQSQSDSISITQIKIRKSGLIIGSSLATTGSLLYLNQAWYKNHSTGQFHFFNDNKEWLQMDKAGHVYTNYILSNYMMESFEWAGFSRKKSVFIGGNIGLAYMTCIEVFDGYSDGWGFSWGDCLSNVAGTYWAMGQKMLFNEQKCWLKFSFSRSGLAQHNPNLLGSGLGLEILKDYNGQTYWFSFNPLNFSKTKPKSTLLNVLNLSFGYGAYGMLGGHYNQFVVQNEAGDVLKFNRERRFYLSLDLDLTKIKTKRKGLKTLFLALNSIKVPMPTIQFNQNGLRFYPLYF